MSRSAEKYICEDTEDSWGLMRRNERPTLKEVTKTSEVLFLATLNSINQRQLQTTVDKYW